MNIELNNASAESVEKEGEKVTGGEEANQDADNSQASTSPGAEQNNTELTPTEDTKKEDMTGYNEHPDQAKVAGG